ncbi:hypothetical protein AB3S75_023409 [Citrus x aurantiifolia]
MNSRAKNWLLMEYGKALWNKISVPPYQRKDSDVTQDDEATLIVLSCCWGPGNLETTLVMLDSADKLSTQYLTSWSQNVHHQQGKTYGQKNLLKFMMDHQPHVVVVGAANLSCTSLKDDIYEVKH